MKFITIDFETATSKRESPCEIGLTFVEDGNITETKSWLIKPWNNVYDPWNSRIHGIYPADTKNCPEFIDLWPEILSLLDNQLLIAHNASFDMSVLRKTLDLYNISYPTFDYACSYIFSKNVWGGQPSYGLSWLCKYNGITLHHHRAAEDSLATAKLSLKAFEVANVVSNNCFLSKLNTSIGRIYNNGYQPCTSRISQSAAASKKSLHTAIVGNSSKYNPDSIFFGKKVVFTGTLSSMARTEAQQKIADVGGVLANSVSSNTDFLIVGQQDFRQVGEDGMSSKQEKAVELISRGSKLEVLSEDEFLRNL